MDAINEYSYIWDTEKEKYVLLDDNVGKSILVIDGEEIMLEKRLKNQ